MGLTSREEDILRATIDGTEYTKPPQSRVEELLIELKEAIEQGGGGGGSTVVITPTLETGEKIADYSINGVEGELYAPEGGGTEVVANPEGEATDVLEKLKVGDDIYGVEGGGGTTVVANPEGEPTDVLETIRIGDDIFGLPNSKILIDDVIYTDTSGQTGTLSITLNERLDKYDAIYFEFYFPSESTYVSANPSPLQIVVASPEGASHDYFFQTYPSYGNRYITLESIDGGKNATLVASAWNDLNPSVYKIHGIKFGSSPVQAKNVVLWSGDQTPTAGNPYRANLSTSFRDYDFLVVECHESRDDTNMPFTIPVSSITDDEGYGYEYQQSGIYFVPIDDRHIDLYLFASINPTTYTCIRGIKCGIQKDDPFKKDLLWKGAAHTVNDTGHLGKPITEYPFLMMYWSDSSVSGQNDWHVELVDTSKLTNYEVETFSFEYYTTIYTRGTFTDASNFKITASISESGVYTVLREIYGVDFGSGNGQNGSFQKDLLYAAPTLSGAPLQTDIPYLTDRNFFDYDLITLVQCNSMDGANDYIQATHTFTPDELFNLDGDGTYTLLCTGYKERYTAVQFSEHSFRIPQHAAANESGEYAPSIYKMYGFRFGGNGIPKTSKYLTETFKKDIACEATVDNFDSSSLFWGDGPTPIRLSDPVSIQDDGVLIPVKSDSVFAYVDREITGRPFTAYIVAKLINPDQGGRIMSSLYSHTSNKGILLAGNPIIVSSWANDTATDVASTDYFVGVIQYSSGVGLGKVNDETRIWKPTDKIGQEIVIGRTDINPVGSDEVPSDIIVKYFAVVDYAESMKAIEDNVASLMKRFNIS